MKFICLGYFDEETLDSMPLDEVQAFIAECLAYCNELAANGHIVNIELLQSPDNAKTVKKVDGKVEVTVGAHEKSEKVLIPIVTLDVESIDHAVELMAKHPAIDKSASLEIRPLEDMAEMQGISDGM